MIWIGGIGAGVAYALGWVAFGHVVILAFVLAIWVFAARLERVRGGPGVLCALFLALGSCVAIPILLHTGTAPTGFLDWVYALRPLRSPFPPDLASADPRILRRAIGDIVAAGTMSVAVAWLVLQGDRARRIADSIAAACKPKRMRTMAWATFGYIASVFNVSVPHIDGMKSRLGDGLDPYVTVFGLLLGYFLISIYESPANLPDEADDAESKPAMANDASPADPRHAAGLWGPVGGRR